MTNTEKLMDQHVHNLYDTLRDNYHSYSFGFSVVRLIFLKYAADNSLGSCTMNDMSAYIRLHKMINASGDTDMGANSIAPVLSIIDNHYGLNGIISSTANDFIDDLFGLDESRIRRGANAKSFSLIFAALGKMDLEDDSTFSKGKALARSLINNMHRYMASRYTAPYISRNELCLLAKGLLKIKDHDVFMDFASGVGATSTAITIDTNCRVINYDIDSAVLPISAMLHILCGLKNFTFAKKDYLGLSGDTTHGTIDKIFVDPPLFAGGALNQLESKLAALETAIDLLADGGKAVITAVAGILSHGSERTIAHRKNLVAKRHISHVVALPISWASTTASINLVVLSKTRCDSILMINACSNAFKEYICPQSARIARQSPPISNEGIALLIDTINNNKEIPSLSKMVSVDALLEKDCNLFPVAHISETIKVASSLDAVNAELESLYRSLSKFN